MTNEDTSQPVFTTVQSGASAPAQSMNLTPPPRSSLNYDITLIHPQWSPRKAERPSRHELADSGSLGVVLLYRSWGGSAGLWAHGCNLAQTPLLRFVVDLLYNKSYTPNPQQVHNILTCRDIVELYNKSVSLILTHSRRRLAIDESRANFVIMLRYKSFI